MPAGHGSKGKVVIGTPAHPDGLTSPFDLTPYITGRSMDRSVETADKTTMKPDGGAREFLQGLNGQTHSYPLIYDKAGVLCAFLSDLYAFLYENDATVNVIDYPFDEVSGNQMITTPVILSGQGGPNNDLTNVVNGSMALTRSGESVYDTVA